MMGLMAGCRPEEALESTNASSGSADIPVQLLATPVPSPPPPREDVAAGEVLVDDMYACDAGYQTRIRTWWYVYEDHDRPGEKECNHGRSESTLQVFLGGYKVSPCALRWNGAVQRPHLRNGYAFSGIGVGLGSYDLSQFSSIELVLRGDGKRYRAKLPMAEQVALAREGDCGNDYWNFYGADFSCGNGSLEWSRVTIDLTKLSQEPTWPKQGPGAGFPINRARMKTLEIQTSGHPYDTFQCDIGMVKLIP